jgi:hypothetical protein
MMKLMGLFFIFLLVLTGCKAVSVGSKDTPEKQNLQQQSTSLISLKDEAGSPDAVTSNLVMSEDFIKNGYVVYREKISNPWTNPVALKFSLDSSDYRLFTRINEHFHLSALISPGATGDHSKLSTLALSVTEISAARANGKIDHVDLSDSAATLNLDSSEEIEISWIARGVLNSVVCPFYHTIHTDSGFAAISDLTWTLAGASVTGSFVRTIQALATNSDGSPLDVPVVTQVSQSLNQTASDGIPHPDDRDFGCNGFMQSMN